MPEPDLCLFHSAGNLARARRMTKLLPALAWSLGLTIILCGGLRPAPSSGAEKPKVDVISLPPFRVQGQLAKGHVQGMDWVDGLCYVTARRDDMTPRRALLLR